MKKHELKDSSGSSFVLGIAEDGGSDEDSPVVREWERGKEGKREPCHLAKLLLLLGFMFGS